MNAMDTPVSPLVKGHDKIYTGDETKKIRLMAIVESSPLKIGHSFKNKTELMLRIAEEANLCNIRATVQKSCSLKYEVAGPQFFVAASNNTLLVPNRGYNFSEKSLQSPFTGVWLDNILLPHLELCPGMSYLHMLGLLVDYAMTDLVTDNLLQQARNWAKFKLFGSPKNNVMYCEAVREAIVSNGHSCELLYSNRRDVVRSLQATVIREEIKWRDDANEAALEQDEVDEFLYRFMLTHKVLL
jgi:hypothetical protein